MDGLDLSDDAGMGVPGLQGQSSPQSGMGLNRRRADIGEEIDMPAIVHFVDVAQDPLVFEFHIVDVQGGIQCMP